MHKAALSTTVSLAQVHNLAVKAAQSNNCLEIELCRQVSVYVYIYICCGVIIWSKFGLLRGHYLVQVVFSSKTQFVKKHYKNRGFSRAQISGVIIWSKFAFFKTHPNLDQMLTPTWTR